MISPAVEIRNLEADVAGHRLLNVESFHVPAGAISAVMGRNGAGKTTLLRACLGLVPSARGEIRVLNCSVTQLRSAALTQLRRRIGYVAQLLPPRSEMPLKVREVVSIGRTGSAGLFRSLDKADWQIIDQWIERLGLTVLANRSFNEISGGEQRKTIIARAMAQRPELLLLDEPTANLDLGWRECIVETIEGLHRDTAVTILLVCHELEVIPSACRQVTLLERGGVVASGTPENVFTPERVAALYGTRLKVIHGSGRHGILPEGVAHV